MIGPLVRQALALRFVLPPLVLLLAGCGGVLTSDAPAERVYWLEPLSDVVVDLPNAPSDAERPTVTLSVDAAPGLDTDRLLILEDDARLNEYAAARWADRAPEVVESLLKASLEADGRFLRVADRSAAHVDVRLALELRRFFKRGGNVQIELNGYLDCGDSMHTISARALAPVREERLASIVAAFQIALDDASTSVVRAVAAAHCFQ